MKAITKLFFATFILLSLSPIKGRSDKYNNAIIEYNSIKKNMIAGRKFKTNRKNLIPTMFKAGTIAMAIKNNNINFSIDEIVTILEADEHEWIAHIDTINNAKFTNLLTDTRDIILKRENNIDIIFFKVLLQSAFNEFRQRQ